MTQSIFNKIRSRLITVLLKSPLQRFASDYYLLLTYQGFKTEKKYTFPLAYVRKEQLLCVFTRDAWWQNLARSPAVTVLFRGRQLAGEARLVTDAFLQRAMLCDLVALHGEQRLRKLGFWVDHLEGPAVEVQRAAQGIHFIHLYIPDPF
jgi:hypothetical protein